MIPHIHEQLYLWADWVASGRRVRGLGYPSQVPFSRLTPSTHQHSPIVDEQAWRIEQAIHTLNDKHLACIMQYYLRAGTAETHAKALRVSRDTLYTRLHAAHRGVESFLTISDKSYKNPSN